MKIDISDEASPLFMLSYLHFLFCELSVQIVCPFSTGLKFFFSIYGSPFFLARLVLYVIFVANISLHLFILLCRWTPFGYVVKCINLLFHGTVDFF